MIEERNKKINVETIKSIANFRKKLPITTIERTYLLKVAREQLRKKITSSNADQKASIEIIFQQKLFPEFIFVSLFEKDNVILCLGSPMLGNNLPLTIKNIANELLEKLEKDILKNEQYFEIELLFDPKKLSQSKKEFNPGIHAIKINNTNFYFKSSISIKQNWNLEQLLKNLLKKASFPKNKKADFILFKTVTFKEDIIIDAENPLLYDLYRNNELIFQSEITNQRIEYSFINAAKYIELALNQVSPIYLYSPLDKKHSSPNFIHEWIRVLASFWSLLETCDNVDATIVISIMNTLKKNDAYSNNSFFQKFGVIDLGTNAITTLIEQILNKRNNIEINNKRPEFLLSFIKDNGEFYTFIKDDQYQNGDEHQYFLPFMAMIALIREYHDSDYMSKIENLCFPYYLNFYKKSNKDQKMTMSLWVCRVLLELNFYTKKELYIQEIFYICDSLLEYQNYPLDENIDLFGSFTNDYTTCTTAVILETLSIGLILSSKIDDRRKRKYLKAIQYGMRFLIQMQYTEHNSFDKAVIGGFQFSPFCKVIRIDVVQHALFAMKNSIGYFSLHEKL